MRISSLSLFHQCILFFFFKSINFCGSIVGLQCFPHFGCTAKGFVDGAVVKNLPADAGDAGSIPGWGRSPGGGNGHPLQSSCLENPMERGAWRAAVHGGHKESDTSE